MKTKLPFGGWMPGERQYMTGPFFMSAPAALHIATIDGPRITGGLDAMICVASCTAVCGLDWSS